jgi:hypothetical protein
MHIHVYGNEREKFSIPFEMMRYLCTESRRTKIEGRGVTAAVAADGRFGEEEPK